MRLTTIISIAAVCLMVVVPGALAGQQSTRIGTGTKVHRSVLLGSDVYEDQPDAGLPALGIGRDVVLDRVVIDKNARIGDGVRLVNEKGVQHADGDGYCIRSGIIVVPKGGVIPAGTVV